MMPFTSGLRLRHVVNNKLKTLLSAVFAHVNRPTAVIFIALSKTIFSFVKVVVVHSLFLCYNLLTDR